MDQILALASLFASAFVSATLWPGGSEFVLYIMAGHKSAPLGMLWATATLGNSLGGISSWMIGRFLPRHYRRRTQGRAKCMQIQIDKLRRWGSPLLVLSWLPLIGDALCLAAGWIRIAPLPAFLYIALGKGMRYAIIMMAVS